MTSTGPVWLWLGTLLLCGCGLFSPGAKAAMTEAGFHTARDVRAAFLADADDAGDWDLPTFNAGHCRRALVKKLRLCSPFSASRRRPHEISAERNVTSGLDVRISVLDSVLPAEWMPRHMALEQPGNARGQEIRSVIRAMGP